jgi:hypothetical protein
MTITYVDTISCDACTLPIGLDSGDGYADMVDGAMITVTGWRLCPPCADLCTLPGYRVSGTCNYSEINGD